MLDTTGLDSQDSQLLQNLYDEVDNIFNNEIVDETEIPLEELSLFKHYSHFFFRQAIRIKEGAENAYIAIIQVAYSYMGTKGGMHTSTEYQAWAYCRLPEHFGHLIIKPETFKDRLIELFQPMEMNFPDDREFCRRFYVLSKDWQKAQQLLTPGFREALKKLYIRDLQVEVYNNFLIAGNCKKLDREHIIALAGFVHHVAEMRFPFYRG